MNSLQRYWRQRFGILALLILASSTCSAHQLRVAKLSIQELGEGDYVLRYEVPVGEEDIYPLPELPDHAQWLSLPRHLQGSLQLQFHSDQGLSVNDEIRLRWKRSGAMVSASWLDGSGAKQFFPVGKTGIVVGLDQLQASSGNLWTLASRYTALGVHHILIGIDHLFFITGMLLLVSSRRKLLWAISYFTLAHSITLALAVLDIVRLPTAVVEWLIALSIVLMAQEILRAQRGVAGLAWQRPWMVAFAFGLVHGLGFAAALGELGIERDAIAQILLFFNFGVELGQLAFIGALWLLMAVWRRLGFPHYIGGLKALPAYIIGIMAMIWLLTRSSALLA